MREAPANPPFRNELTWGGQGRFSLPNGGPFLANANAALVLMNCAGMPVRTWALMCAVSAEGGNVPLAVGSVIRTRFSFLIGVGQTQQRVERIVQISQGATVVVSDRSPFAVDILPASTITLDQVVMAFTVVGGGQAFPVPLTFAAFAAPQFPLLQTLEMAK